MNSKAHATNASPSHLTGRQLHTAVIRLRDSEECLRTHRAFIRAGGEIRWVIDTDVAKLFLAPRDTAKYADLFGTHAAEQTPSASLSALAGLLADFIFGRRFRFEGPESAELYRVMLEPHTEEFDEVVRAIAKRARDQALPAGQAVNGGIVETVNRLISDYTNNLSDELRPLSQKEFVEKLQKTMSDAINILQPTGPMAELRRARDLLKERSLKYQADVPNLRALLSSPVVQDALNHGTEIWLSRYKDFLQSTRQSNHDETFGKRAAVRTFRDARVLAVLDWLNFSQVEAKVRYVLLSGTGALAGLVNRLQRDRVTHAVHVVPPWAFLGNPWLFARDLDHDELSEEPSVADDHPQRWQRITDAVNFLGKIPEIDLNQHGALIDKLLHEWRELEKMALPYLPVQAPPPNVRDLARAIFSGASLEALEAQLYVALSEFFVLTAELGLAAYQEPLNGGFKRKPPPLRLAFYPAAEDFVCDVVERKFWDADGRINLGLINRSIGAVKKEQGTEEKNSKLPSFNYTLLLCFAVRYATMGEWHACRILAGHAKAVAVVLQEVVPFVTGRDAALLESYCRRLEAKKADDLVKARDALNEFDAACVREQEAWRSQLSDAGMAEKCAKLHFNPSSEFALHRLRGQVEELSIEFSTLMFGCFLEFESGTELTQRLSSNKQRFLVLQSMSLESLATLKDIRPGLGDSVSVRSVAAILDFLKGQLDLCGLQCALFLTAVDEESGVSLVWKRADIWRDVASHDTDISRLAGFTAGCIWADDSDKARYLELLKALKPSQVVPYDEARHKFFTGLGQKCAVSA